MDHCFGAIAVSFARQALPTRRFRAGPLEHVLGPTLPPIIMEVDQQPPGILTSKRLSTSKSLFQGVYLS